ncbi:MAG: polysaccharide export protein [Methylobacteriaceae bacterium]|nr:polysaccharide export protein [Methylobacteriaceae bacterium]
MNRRSLLALLLLSAPAAGCMRTARSGPPPSSPATTGSLRPVPQPPGRPDARPVRADSWGPEGYTLATGDKLRVIVFGQDSLSNIYQVDGAGRITMPLVGPVEVGGMGTAGAAGAIEGRLRAGYLREPKVSVEVDTYRPFFILGEVTTSGQFPYQSGMTVQTAVALAGGFTPRGERGTAEVTRRTPRGLSTAEVPITFPIRPGDTIVIKERWF